MHCVHNAWPPVSEMVVVLEALMRTWTKCLCSQPGAGACAELRALLLRALGSPGRKAFAGESTALFGTNSAATKQPSNFHLRNTPELVTTQSRETTKGTNRYPSSALDR